MNGESEERELTGIWKVIEILVFYFLDMVDIVVYSFCSCLLGMMFTALLFVPPCAMIAFFSSHETAKSIFYQNICIGGGILGLFIYYMFLDQRRAQKEAK